MIMNVKYSSEESTLEYPIWFDHFCVFVLHMGFNM